MPANRDSATLLDIAKAARKILQFKQGLDKSAFLADEKLNPRSFFNYSLWAKQSSGFPKTSEPLTLVFPGV
ncbi:MAG TPA: hypothetical protein V6D18_08410 [Thermosynechococcaceae cyanobacterium]